MRKVWPFLKIVLCTLGIVAMGFTSFYFMRDTFSSTEVSGIVKTIMLYTSVIHFAVVTKVLIDIGNK